MEIDLTKINLQSKPEEKNSWLLSYSDMVTLLLCFFALFFAISQIDKVKFEIISEYFNQTNKMPLHQLEDQVKTLINEHQMEDVIEVNLTPDGLELNFQDKILFDSGKSELKTAAFPILSSLGNILKTSHVKDRKIQVAGHTDTVPISQNSIYPSNWELSTARASQVIRYFLSRDLIKERFEAIGYADTKLRQPETPQGRGLAVNRRVVLLIK